MNMVKFTNASDAPVWVNSRAVTHVQPIESPDAATAVWFAGGSIRVKELAVEVISRLENAS